MRELVNSQNTPPFDRLYLLLVGPEGSGKSWLASTGRQSVFFFDFDGKLSALSGRRNVFGVSYRDSNKAGIQPMAISEALTDLTKIEASRSLKTFGFNLTEGQNDIIKTVVVDSVYTLGKACRDYALYTTPDIARTVKIPQMPVNFPNGFDGWNAEMATVESFILRLLAIPGIDVIVTGHETQAKDPLLSTTDSKGNLVTRRGSKVSLFPERHNGIVKYFNEIWRLSRTQAGAPTITFNPTNTFVNARSNLAAERFKPGEANISAMLPQGVTK